MKRLFTNIDVNVYGVSDNEYYKNIVEELKKCNWEKLPDNKFLCVSVDWLTFYKMTAIDYRYFAEKNIAFRYEIFFIKLPDGQFEYEVNFYEKEERQYSDYLIVENDDLELFQVVEEEKPETDWRNLLSNVLENALKETDVDSIVEFIDNNFADVSNKIRENFSDNLEVDDIGEVLKQDIAEDWIEQNPDDAYDRAVDNMDSYEMRDKIIDYLQNNL